MKNLKLLLTLIFIHYSYNSFSQAEVNWEWKNNSGITFDDLEYKNGYIYAVGNYTGPSVTLGVNTFFNNGGSDIVVAKLDTSGNVIWANSYGSTGADSVKNLAVDNNENICVIGFFSNTMTVGPTTLISAGGTDIFMLKFNSNGGTVLAKRAGGVNADKGEDIAADNAGAIYIVANAGGMAFAGLNCPVNGRAVIKYAGNGTEIKMRWIEPSTNVPSGAGSTVYSVRSIKYSSFDNSLVFGGHMNSGGLAYTGGIGPWNNTIYSINNLTDIFLVRIDTALGQLYKANPTSNANKTNMLQDMCIGNTGQIYCAQRFQYSLNGYGYNEWIQYNLSLQYVATKSLINSGEPYSAGYPLKMFYNNNTIYGTLFQTWGPSNCTDYYAMKWDITNNSTSYILLGPDASYSGIAGNNGRYYIGSNQGIGKTCEGNCNTPLTINPADDITICSAYGGYIGRCFYVQGGAPAYSYSWSPVTGLSNPNIARPYISGLAVSTIYTLTVTDQNNNTVYDTVNVTVNVSPVITLSFSANPMCNGDTITITASGASTYYWAYPFYIAGQSITVAPTASTQGSVVGTDTNGCQTTLGYYIYVNNPTFSTTNTTICSNQTPYSWNGQNLVATGTYTSTLVNANGCDSTATLYLTVNDTTISTTNLNVCAYQIPYNWNGQSLDSNGTYTAYFTNAMGCDSVALLNFSIVACGPCLTDVTINSNPFTDPLTQSQTWIITSGTVLVPAGSQVRLDANTNSYVTLNPGFKAEHGSVFVAQAYNGCTAGAPQLPNAKVFKGYPSAAADEIVLYPNPTSGMIHIKHDEKLTGIQIFDMVSKLVIDQKCAGEAETNIDLSNLPNGVYHVKAAGYNSMKVVKNN